MRKHRTIRPGSQHGHRTRKLLKTTGNILLIEHRTVGMAEVGDKPGSLWDCPDLQRLYARQDDEYEIRERQAALERKLSLITRTAETVVNLLQHQSSMRVE